MFEDVCPFPKVEYVSSLLSLYFNFQMPRQVKFHTLISIHRVFGPPAVKGLCVFGVLSKQQNDKMFEMMKWEWDMRWHKSIVTSEAIMCTPQKT